MTESGQTCYMTSTRRPEPFRDVPKVAANVAAVRAVSLVLSNLRRLMIWRRARCRRTTRSGVERVENNGTLGAYSFISKISRRTLRDEKSRAQHEEHYHYGPRD